MTAPCLMGLEGLAAEELRALGAADVTAENGRVLFSGGGELLARANIGCRYVERILLLVGEFPAATFTQLFDAVRALPWEDYIGNRDAFPVKGWSLHSQLHSVPDCQAIVKKAVVERLKAHYGTVWFEETGPKHQIRFSILKDRVSVMIDTSGPALHKRGYRPDAAPAPIRETLAAAMVKLMRLYPDSKLYDPFCGSGTILIEGAMLAHGIAPGLRRGFAAERFGWIADEIWRAERERALSLRSISPDFQAFGSDIDPRALELTRRCAKLAGVEASISTARRDVADFAPETERGAVITNPPYGERLLNVRRAQELIRTMGRRFEKRRGWRYGILSPDEAFEALFGRPADKRRKLYNGMIPCRYYMYFKG